MDTVTVTITKPSDGDIWTDRFDVDDYWDGEKSYSDALADLHNAVVAYCHESVELGWDVVAIDTSSGRVIYSHKH